MDYQTQQYKLFPAIAASVVYKFVAKWLCDKYATVNSEIERGDLQQLPEVSSTLYNLNFLIISVVRHYNIVYCVKRFENHGESVQMLLRDN